jgi:hypothetical protein
MHLFDAFHPILVGLYSGRCVVCILMDTFSNSAPISLRPTPCYRQASPGLWRQTFLVRSSGPRFRWDEERRFLLRSELDAAFFHLYLGPQSEWQQQPEALTRAFATPRHAVSYIMDTFPIVKRKDETKHGHYRTQATILQIYDALTEAMQSGMPHKTLLTPPPADLACCHPPKN